MSRIRTSHVFTSESVGKGHPDKLCDQVSDAILDACLKLDPHSRVACETMAGFNMVINVGEITCNGFEKIDTESITRETVRKIGYDCAELRFCHDTFEYLSRIHGQSPDISQGVPKGEGLYEEQGAGDQGMMFGYATRETPEMLPVPIAFSHRLLKRFETLRKDKILDYLRPDAKAQVSVHYAGGKPQRISSIVLSHQTGHVSPERIRKDAIEVIRQELDPTGLLDQSTAYFVNPTGSFVLGGPFADAGLTGRKIIVDTYGTSVVDESAIQGLLEDGDLFDFRPAAIIDQLTLLTPNGWDYESTAAYGHFGRTHFPWEQTDKVDVLKRIFKKMKAA